MTKPTILTDEQLLALIDAGDEILFDAGDTLWHEGEHAGYWWVLVAGTLDFRRRVGREETVVGRFDAPGRWAGGFRAWDEHGVYLATGRATSRGRMLRVPAPALHDLLAAYPLVAHLVGGLFHTARNIEAGARQREALMALGKLSAGLAHELNQVWTNLIDNAVDAMDGAGTLGISTRADGDAVIIGIGDNGCGMSAEVAERAFEAFFTTKDVGKGTGLGLDIARRIVEERHGGSIAIASRPGDTVVTVRLPVRQPAY